MTASVYRGRTPGETVFEDRRVIENAGDGKKRRKNETTAGAPGVMEGMEGASRPRFRRCAKDETTRGHLGGPSDRGAGNTNSSDLVED